MAKETSPARKAFVEEFGMAVRRRRGEINLSQEELADKSDIHRTQISLIELGKNEIKVGALPCLTDALKLPMHVFIKRITDKVNPK